MPAHQTRAVHQAWSTATGSGLISCVHSANKHSSIAVDSVIWLKLGGNYETYALYIVYGRNWRWNLPSFIKVNKNAVFPIITFGWAHPGKLMTANIFFLSTFQFLVSTWTRLKVRERKCGEEKGGGNAIETKSTLPRFSLYRVWLKHIKCTASTTFFCVFSGAGFLSYTYE